MMLMISPSGQLGLWAPSLGVRDVITSFAYVRDRRLQELRISTAIRLLQEVNIDTEIRSHRWMSLIISPSGQLGLWAPSVGVRDVITSIA